jgi:hypothetical protein
MEPQKVAIRTLSRIKLARVLVLCGLAGPLILILAQSAVLPSAVDYSLVRDSISSLAWTNLGWIQDCSFVITGLLMEAFAAVILLAMPRSRGLVPGVVLLACSGFGLLLSGAFRTDAQYLPSTLDGAIHGFASNGMFLLLPLASLMIAPSLRQGKSWNLLFVYSISTAVFALIWIGIYRFFLPRELPWFGLYERILAANEFIWIEVVAVWVIRSRWISSRTKDART